MMHDTSGNALMVIPNGNFITVTLKLAKPYPSQRKNYPRKLGVIDCSSRVMTCFRNRERHLHLKSYSYGFNFYLIKNATKFDKILIDEKFGRERHKYLIPREVILQEGTFLNFSKQGFELQIFLGFERIKTFEL